MKWKQNKHIASNGKWKNLELYYAWKTAWLTLLTEVEKHTGG